MAQKKRKKSSSKKKSVASILSKLDPLLICGASRASKEKASDFQFFPDMSLTEDARLSYGLPKFIPLGAQTLADRMSPASLDRFAEKDVVPLLVETSDVGKVEKQLKSWRTNYRRVTEKVVSVELPRRKLMALAELNFVDYVESSVVMEPHCDEAHKSARFIVGDQRPSQTGKGVLIGVVDTGIDVSHPAFKKTNGKTRILKYIDQNTGEEFSEDQINAGEASRSQDTVGHGTHVAGIAAGNGASSPRKILHGIATEADLAIVKTSFGSKEIAQAVKDIFDLADALNKPCVVNLSLGGHFGPHDGSSVIERAIDQLSGKGKIVVTSAGNEGAARIHAHIHMNQPAIDRWVADMELKPRVLQGQVLGFLTVQIWHQREDEIDITLRSPNGELIIPPTSGTKEVDRGVFFVEVNRHVARYSGDHCTTFTIITVPQSQWVTGWSIIAERVLDSGGNSKTHVGVVHAWIVNRNMGEFTRGSTQSHLVGMPGTAFSAITVASYATKKEWISQDPDEENVKLNAVNLEDISYFSSPGPTRDGQNKPEIAAPGQWLAAPLSKDATEQAIPPWTRQKGLKYTAMQGTSMSAPYVTGAIALLLQKNPNLDWAEVKRRLMKSVFQDAFSQPCWNNRWGYGKLDVQRLLSIEPEHDGS